ncbi:MAG: ATP-binding protein, partial [Actinomycetia bacterium]|nr:ATP-binding protein [Actinomycetes bacterium]
QELYQRLATSAEQVRAMRHDFRHQLAALRAYLQAQDITGALEYINQLSAASPSFADLTITDNFAVNAVLYHYLALARAENIQTDLQLVVPADLGRVSESDMNIIIGNLFENAIEATRYLPVEQRVIRMRSQLVGQNLTITIDNSFDGYLNRQGGVFYSRKRTGKGIGLSSVQSVVQRYDGSLKIEVANGQFMVSLVIRI